ncbi:hypothetical protein [Streptosporangium sp. NPDC002524]|uniref:hypothetical protein n=1 Tax=Streptosporangium sp. NPDC002524 TaxID=3154537 RepID=UPI00331E796E
MDLSAYRGYFLDSVVVHAGSAASTATIGLTSGADDSAIIELFGVVHVTMDSPDAGGDLIDEAVVRDLPRTGAWPAEARHLLHLHNNDSELVWLKVIGPRKVEMVARRLTTERRSGARSRTNTNPPHGGGVPGHADGARTRSPG